jgi:hypothetical protein
VAAVLTGTVYVGYDNAILLGLTEDDAAQDLTTVTKIGFDFGGAYKFDSDTHPLQIEWTTGENSQVALKMGLIPEWAEIADGTTLTGRMIVYFEADPEGIVWIEKVKLKFKQPLP